MKDCRTPNQTPGLKMSRRKFLMGTAALTLGYAATRAWPNDGLLNACLANDIPDSLLNHELVKAAWEGIDATQFWDCHTHLVGIGDGVGTGTWVNPNLRSIMHPFQRIQFAFYLNASCANQERDVDSQFVARLRLLLNEFPAGAKAMLLAFDYYHDQDGLPDKTRSTFHTPNTYAAKLAHAFPERFEWIASIHPYQTDALEELKSAIAHGARAVKWLPPAMGIDPASPRCDAFYEMLAHHNIPLLTHAGHEHAVDAAQLQELGNPLLLRRALDHGVRVILAHCASLGTSVDRDKGSHGPQTANIDLFARLMLEPRYEHLLFADISAITQMNRNDATLRRIFHESNWHPRLLNGSDYPLPGIVPLFSLSRFVDRGYLSSSKATVLSKIREYNPLMFDFVLKRSLSLDGIGLPTSVFQTRARFSA